ncbi:hypothetical protein GPECTOR_82g265 [Gonium pectorale]|uniref:SRCR domain-containing protein n=1 Tax=Gonium pectorale TaxID=33097 RepID=A0A150G1P1_GONPE|nr:hypothetical protein GPECTOR_82g265 [Gonium pectorale]|eukprot:KXZ43731.1 hypothetical protein GPECTOR_82g265 [Gonium pectorale]
MLPAVFYGSAFGAVCDDRFTDAAARVVCRQLGKAGGKARCCGAFGASPGSILLDEVVCRGNETRLDECRNNGWGQSDCRPEEAVGVECSEAVASSPGLADGKDLQLPGVISAAFNRSDSPPVISVHYRVVYSFPDGSRSCPSWAMAYNETFEGTLVFYLQFKNMTASASASAGAAGGAVAALGDMVVQRRGQRRSIMANVGTSVRRWLLDTWIDVYSFNASVNIGGWVYLMDRKQSYDADGGALTPPGPLVAGWRWKYGSTGITDGYVPSMFPELTAAESPSGAGGGRGGINVTYQLVYQKTDGYLTYPDPNRFHVYSEVATTPLMIYVQLVSLVPPTDMAALLLQRVEGDSAWTVGRLTPDSVQIKTGSRALLFTDSFPLRTHGDCNYGSTLRQASLTPERSPGMASMASPPSSDSARTQQGPAPESAITARSSALALKSAVVEDVSPDVSERTTCTLILIGYSGRTFSLSEILTASPEAVAPTLFREASLDCKSNKPDAEDVWIAVGYYLAPIFKGTGVYIQSPEEHGNVDIPYHWGITVSGLESLTLVDSIISDVPLSPYGPLFRCGSCVTMNFYNTTFQNLLAPKLPVTSAHRIHGAVGVSDTWSVDIRNLKCSNIHGAHGWSCLVLEFQSALVFTNSTLANNRASNGGAMHLSDVVQLDFNQGTRVDNNSASGMGSFTIEGGGRVSNNALLYNGDGGVLYSQTRIGSFVIRGAGSTASNNSARFGSGGVLATSTLPKLEISDGGSLVGNTAGTGSGGAIEVEFSITSLLIDAGSVRDNNAALAGGAIYIGQNVVEDVLVTHGSVVEGNMALSRSGGFLAVGGSVRGQLEIDGGSRICYCTSAQSGGAVSVQEGIYGRLAVIDNSTMCWNVAQDGNGGAVHSGFAVGQLLVSAGGSLANNSASGDGGAVYAGRTLSAVFVTTEGALVGNYAGGDGGAVFTDYIGVLHVSEGSVALGNAAGGDGGVASSSRIGAIMLQSCHISANRAGRSGGAVASLAPPDRIAVSDSVLQDNVAERGFGGVLSVSCPQPGSQLLSQVAANTNYTISDGSVFKRNGAYLDGGCLSIAAEAPSDPVNERTNEPYVALTVTIQDSAFHDNYAGGAGGAVSLASPSAGSLAAALLVASSNFSGNTAGSDRFPLGSSVASGFGGAISVQSTPKFKADAAMVAARASTLRLAAVRGGAAADSVSLDSACALRLESSRFEGNGCQANGGAVAAVSCPAAVRNCTFLNNRAQRSGGGLASLIEPIAVSDLEVADAATQRRLAVLDPSLLDSGFNVSGDATITGGALTRSWWLDVQASTFEGNAASAECGGGMYVEVTQGADSLIDGCILSRNGAADSHGGGVCINALRGAGEALLTGDQLLNNTASRLGGGVFAQLLGVGSFVRVVGSELVGNQAIQGGGGFAVSSVPGAAALLSHVSVVENAAIVDGGALVAHCAAGAAAGSAAEGSVNGTLPSCGSVPILTLHGCNLTRNSARSGHGGGLYVTAGASVDLYGCNMYGNRAGSAGGGLAAVGCDGLNVVGGSVDGGSALQGGGIFAQACQRVLMHGLSIEGNLALTGGGAFLAGVSKDNVTLPSLALADPGRPSTVALANCSIENNQALRIADIAQLLAPGETVFAAPSYQRFGGHGGGLFVFGNISLLADQSDLAAGNKALVGSAIGSAQWCAEPQAPQLALARLSAGPGPFLADAAGAVQYTQLLAPGETVFAAPSYQRFGGHGGGLFVFGNISLLADQSDLAAGNKALVGSAIGSAQWCAEPQAPQLALARLSAGPGPFLADAAGAVQYTQWELLESLGTQQGCWSLLLDQVRLPPRLYLPIWMLDPVAVALWARCDDAYATTRQAATANGVTAATVAASTLSAQIRLNCGSEPSRTCALAESLRICSGEDRDTLRMRVNVSVEPLNPSFTGTICDPNQLPATAGGRADARGGQDTGSASRPCDSSHLSDNPDAAWRDARIAYLDTGSAQGGSQTVAMNNSLASWPYLTIRAWPGRYALVFRAFSEDDPELYQVEELRVAVDVLHCQPGEALDLTWSQQPGALASWLGCTRCSRGRFTLWRDDRPALSELNMTHYLTYIRLSYEATTPVLSSAVVIRNASNSGDAGDAEQVPAGTDGLSAFLAACVAAGLSGNDSSGAKPYQQLECAPGYTGTLCAACQPGYYINSEFQCRACPERNLVLTILAFLASIGVVLGVSLTSFAERPASRYEYEDADDRVGGRRGSSTKRARREERVPPSEFLKVAIVHAQFYIIITRLPVAYPDVISRMQATLSAVTGAESTVAFSYSCIIPDQASDGQARSQLLGALIVPVAVIACSLVIWALRYYFRKDARMRRQEAKRRAKMGPKPPAAGNPGATAIHLTAAAAPSLARSPGSSFTHMTVLTPPYSAAAALIPSPFADKTVTSVVSLKDGNVSARDDSTTSRPKGKGGESTVSFALSPTVSLTKTVSVESTGIRHIVGHIHKAVAGSMYDLKRSILRLDETLGLWRQLGVVGMMAVLILYPGWAQAALSVFACYRVDDGVNGPFPERQLATWRSGYWIRDMQQACYAGRHLGMYVPIGVVAVIFVCLLPPLLSFLLLWFKRRELDDPRIMQHYGFLYMRYKQRYYWWESVLMLEELGMVAVEVFGRALPVVSHQVLLMLCTFIIVSTANMACSPVKSRLISLLEFLSLCVLSLTLTLSLFFVVDKELDLGVATLVGVIIIVVNGALFGGFLGALVMQNWGSIRAAAAVVGGWFRRKPTARQSGDAEEEAKDMHVPPGPREETWHIGAFATARAAPAAALYGNHPVNDKPINLTAYATANAAVALEPKASGEVDKPMEPEKEQAQEEGKGGKEADAEPLLDTAPTRRYDAPIFLSDGELHERPSRQQRALERASRQSRPPESFSRQSRPTPDASTRSTPVALARATPMYPHQSPPQAEPQSGPLAAPPVVPPSAPPSALLSTPSAPPSALLSTPSAPPPFEQPAGAAHRPHAPPARQGGRENDAYVEAMQRRFPNMVVLALED